MSGPKRNEAEMSVGRNLNVEISMGPKCEESETSEAETSLLKMAGRGEPSTHSSKEDNDSIYKHFHREHKREMEIILITFKSGALVDCLIRALRITAADINFFRSFSSASISFSNFDDSDDKVPYSLRSVFWKAFKIVDAFFNSDPDDPILPDDPKSKKALDMLLRFVINSSNVWDTLYEDEGDHGEWNWTLKLAQHVFTQLSLHPKYKYDISKDYKSLGCPCKHGDKILGEKEDTSFGWEDGWHGKVDVLMAGIPVFETTEQDATCETDTGSSISWEIKNKETNFTVGDYGQIGAETITFSFLKNKGGNNEISMIPSIAVTKNAVQVHFYDSVNDVFLQSGLVNLSEKGDKYIRPPAILLIWLALNYNLFYTGIKETLPKSGLHEMINVEKLSRDIKAPCHWKEENPASFILEKSWSKNLFFKDEIWDKDGK